MSTSVAFADEDVTMEGIQSRIAELNPPEKGVPEDQIGLNDERQSLASELSKYRSFVQESDDHSTSRNAIEKAKSEATQMFEDFSKISDCKTLTSAQSDVVLALWRPRHQIQRVIFNEDLDSVEDPWEDAPVTQTREQIKPEDACARWKSFLARNGRQESLLNYFDTLKSNLSERSKANADEKIKAQALIELLQKRRESVEKKLAKTATQVTLTEKFWVALLVIGVFGVGTILAVRLFSSDIQLEWVASGQVIQFVTVMILLSVVMALGLAGILTENTLGTLLGGIAGYVLAQGVGRAAAREVSRSQTPSPGAGKV